MTCDEFEKITGLRVSSFARFTEAISLPHEDEYETLVSGTYRSDASFQDLAAGIVDLLVRPGFTVSEIEPGAGKKVWYVMSPNEKETWVVSLNDDGSHRTVTVEFSRMRAAHTLRERHGSPKKARPR